MQVASDRECFVCGPENSSGLQVRFIVDKETRSAETTVVLAERFQGWRGVVHGGIVSALLDEAAIYACRPLSPHAVTTRLTVRFRRPVSTGREVLIRSEVVSVRRNLVEARSTLSADSAVLAEAEVKIMLLDEEREVTP